MLTCGVAGAPFDGAVAAGCAVDGAGITAAGGWTVEAAGAAVDTAA